MDPMILIDLGHIRPQIIDEELKRIYTSVKYISPHPPLQREREK